MSQPVLSRPARRRSLRSAFFMLLAASTLLAAAPALADSISDETPPYSCGSRLLSGIECSGKYCDNVTLLCGRSRYEIEDIHWTGFVSEERPNEIGCSDRGRDSRGSSYRREDRRRDDRRRDDRRSSRSRRESSFITGLMCKDDYCDNLALECVTLHDAYAETGRRCEWTPWVSEEERGLSFPRGYAAIAMSCRGDFCDDKSFYVCPIRNR